MTITAQELLEHKGYRGSVEIDFDSDTLHGLVQGIPDVVHYEAAGPQALDRAFRESVDDYLAFCQASGKPAAPPAST